MTSSGTTVNSNDAEYDERLQFIDTVMNEEFGVKPRSVTPIAYERGFPFPYNNFIFVVEFDTPPPSFKRVGTVPGIEQIPPGTTRFILRLPNRVSGYNDEFRVENEVAALKIARQALDSDLSQLIPRVFGWESSKGGLQGWILQELMPGQGLLNDFEGLDVEAQKELLEQMVDVLAGFQRIILPDTIKQYGGLTFDASGSIVSAPMSIANMGPFDTYNDLVLGTIRQKLSEADHDAWVQGWRENGIRDRLDAFLKSSVPVLMESVTERKKTLVHADFSTDNVLYDPRTNRITGVFDFDFGHVGTVADDFFRSLGHGLGRFPDPRDGAETLPLNKAMLEGFPDPLPPATEQIQWPAAKMWDDALQAKGAFRPATIPGMKPLSELFWLSSQILPWKLTNPVVVGNTSPDKLKKWKKDGEELLSDFLTSHGY